MFGVSALPTPLIAALKGRAVGLCAAAHECAFAAIPHAEYGAAAAKGGAAFLQKSVRNNEVNAKRVAVKAPLCTGEQGHALMTNDDYVICVHT